MKLYGIPNCSTVKRARTWLADAGIAMPFHDFRKDGLDASTVDAWMDRLDWKVLVNRSGMTWRKLPDARKTAISNRAAARALMLEQPTVIKRPVLELDGAVHVGFDDTIWQALFRGRAH